MGLIHQTFVHTDMIYISLKMGKSKNKIYKWSRPLPVSRAFGFKIALFRSLYTLVQSCETLCFSEHTITLLTLKINNHLFKFLCSQSDQSLERKFICSSSRNRSYWNPVYIVTTWLLAYHAPVCGYFMAVKRKVVWALVVTQGRVT